VTAIHLILLSGGMDSACVLAERRNSTDRISALYVGYGQAAAEAERASSRLIADHYQVSWAELSVHGLVVPSGEIPGRNALLIHLAVAHLGSVHPSCIHLGIHGGTPYRDCSPTFLKEVQRSLDYQTGGGCQLVAPFLRWNKGQVLHRAVELDVPLHMTHSCECSKSPCGNCASCKDREAALASV
jgi:7-cyano-7-deazaguanine synthase